MKSLLPSESRNLFWKLAAFYATYFFVFGIYMPYWPLWLNDIGLTPIEIGWVLAGAFWIKVIVQPAVAHFSDATGRTRILTAVLMGMSAIGFIILSDLRSFWLVFLLTLITAACYQPVLPIMESVILHFTKIRKLRYGDIRLWGSVTFIIATLGGGWLFDEGRSDRIIWLLVGGMTLVSLSCLLVPNPVRFERTSSKIKTHMEIFLSPLFIFFLITTGLTHVSHSVLYGFGTLYWRSLGHSEVIIGLFWSVGVLAEIVLFTTIGRIEKQIGYLFLLSLASVAAAIRWPLLAIFDSQFAIILLQILHGFTFGAAHLGAMAFLTQNVPREISATGQSLYYTLVGGIFSGCMLPFAGMLYSDLAGDAFFVMSCVAGCSLISLFILNQIAKQNPEAISN